MRYKTFFRVTLKLLGVWFVANGVLDLFDELASLLIVFSLQSRAPGLWPFLGGFVAALASLGIGAYLFFGGRLVADLAIPGNRRYCHERGYDLTGVTGHECSECGVALPPERTASA